MSNTCLIDANVLFKQNITDIIIALATRDLFEIKWTKQIENEWLLSKIKQQVKEKGKQKTQTILEEKIAYMNNKFPKAIVN